MRTLAALLVVLVGTAACEDVTELVTPPGTPPPTTPPTDTAPATAYGDPGPPATFYGPKCTFSHSVGKPPSCISGVVTPTPAGLHVYLNFCVANGMNVCQREPEIYVSLVLPLAEWKAGARATEAVGGKAWIELFDGRKHAAQAEAGRPIPLDFQILAAPVEGGGTTEYALLQMTLPRSDGAGEPLVINARIN